MPDESRIAFSCGNNQKSRNGIHAVAQTFSPLKYPIHGGRHTVRQRRLYTRVDVDKVDGPWPCRGDDAKIVALRKQGIERTESIRPRIVAARDICLEAEAWFQRNGWKPVTGFRCYSPRPNICGPEAPELQECFIVEIPTGCRLSDGTRQAPTDTVTHFVGSASVECGFFSIETKVIGVQSDAPCQRPDTIHAPKSDCMVRRVVKKTGLVQVGAHREAINLPGADSGLYLEPVKTQADIRTLPHINQAARAVFHLLSASSELNPVPIISCSDLDKCGLEIQLLLVDWPRAADTVRIQTAFQFYERAHVLSVMDVKIKHIPFVEIAVHEWLLAPVVVSNLFPNLASFAAHGQEPVVPP